MAHDMQQTCLCLKVVQARSTSMKSRTWVVAQGVQVPRPHAQDIVQPQHPNTEIPWPRTPKESLAPGRNGAAAL